MRLDSKSRLDRFWRVILLITYAGIGPSKTRQFDGYWSRKLAKSSGFHGACRVVGEYRDQQAAKNAEEATVAKKLVRNAGLRGTDEDGAQLDQREFKQTWKSLEKTVLWFHGWYGRNTSGYDLAKIQQIMAVNNFDGLPEDHGISVYVSPDGNSCFAARKTISGHVLAVGLHDHKFQQWYWDGMRMPIGFPGEGGDWGHDWLTREPNPNRGI
jgi:hypothetical protein